MSIRDGHTSNRSHQGNSGENIQSQSLATSYRAMVWRNRLLEQKLNEANKRILAMAQAGIQKQEDRVPGLLDNINDIILVLNNCDRIVSIFGPLTQITDYQTHEIIGQPSCCLFDESYHEDEVIFNQKQDQIPSYIPDQYYAYYHQIKTKIKQLIPVSVSRSALNRDDNSSKDDLSEGSVLIIRVVKENSELRKMAQIIQAIQHGDIDAIRGTDGVIQMIDSKVLADNERLIHELDESNRKLDLFTSSASHDLRSPLLTVTTYLHILQEEFGNTLDDEALKLISPALQSCKRMHTLIDTLLSYAQKRSKQLQWTDVALNDLTTEAIHDLHGSIRESNAQILVDPLPTIKASSIHLRQLFQNLIENAIKYRRPGIQLKIHITATESTINLPAIDEFCQIKVQDNGIGFDEKQTNIIFEPFRQLQAKDQSEGIGLGLFTVKEIVDLHHGSIRVSSTINHGSTFTITLPKTQI